jgi:hypothetical protein
MSKFEKLQEEINIDVGLDSPNNLMNNYINIVLRNPKNQDIKYQLDATKIKFVKDLRIDV